MAINLVTDAKYEEITLNKQGDKIYISPDDSTLIDRFVTGYRQIMEKSKEAHGKIAEIEKKYEGRDDINSSMEMVEEMSRENVQFSNAAAGIVDSIFGEGTTKKYFRDLYEKIPEFLPSADCFIEFFDKLIPELDKLFDGNAKEREKLSRVRMAKYQVQDHKKPQRKGTSK